MKYFLLFVSIAIASYAYYKIADRFNIIDKPNHRSSHTTITIRGGGIVFYIAIMLFFIISGFQYPYFFIATTAIGLLSFMDDIKPLPPSYRLPVQFIAVLLVIVQLQVDLHFLYYIPILIVGVGFINAFNFMDGINGITGMYALSILLVLLFFNMMKLNFIANDLLLLLIFSLVVFAFYNFRNKALFFAGDVGSITLAVAILFIVLKLFIATHAVVVILLVAVYGIDSVLTIIRRILLKEKITEAHRHHLYQKMVDSKKLSHLQTALVYASIQFILAVLVLATYQLNMGMQLIISIAVLFLVSIAYLRAINYYNHTISN